MGSDGLVGMGSTAFHLGGLPQTASLFSQLKERRPDQAQYSPARLMALLKY